MTQLTRREWHRLTLGSFAAAATGVLPGTARRVAAESRFGGVLIGLQSFSFRDMTLDEGIAAMQQLGITSCELWELHVEPRELRRPENRERLRRWRTTVPLDHFAEIGARFEDAGIGLSAYNLSFKDHFSDAEIARGFEMAAALGAPAITASAQMNSVPRIARYAERFGMPVAMHNHSRLDPNEFATPDDFARAMRLGGAAPIAVNLDIGHMVAANHDPLAYLRANHERIVTIHLKDRRRDQGPNTPWGDGDTPIRETLLLLRDEGWDIPANIEYEYAGGDTLTELGRCLDYCKDVLGAGDGRAAGGWRAPFDRAWPAARGRRPAGAGARGRAAGGRSSTGRRRRRGAATGRTRCRTAGGWSTARWRGSAPEATSSPSTSSRASSSASSGRARAAATAGGFSAGGGGGGGSRGVGGNSGVFFGVSEAVDGPVWFSGPEYQILHNAGHRDGEAPITSAGSNYAVHPPDRDVTRPVGEWNRSRLIVDRGRVEHWMNDVHLLSYDLDSADWQARVAASKFADLPSYGRVRRGRVAIQDHGDPVRFRNIRIRELE